MQSRTTQRFRKSFDKLPENVKVNARRVFKKWMNDPGLISLRFKQIYSAKQVYSVRIERGWRALGVKQDDVMIWFWIGSHADYDSLIKKL